MLKEACGVYNKVKWMEAECEEAREGRGLDSVTSLFHGSKLIGKRIAEGSEESCWGEMGWGSGLTNKLPNSLGLG
jgi:hypothetical protein